MLNEKVASLLNEQINKEFYSAYLYLEFSAYFEDEGLDASPTGTRCRRRRNGITAMLSSSISRTTATARCWEGIARPTAAPNGRLEVLKAAWPMSSMSPI